MMNDRGNRLVVLSALEPETLTVLASQLLEHLRNHPDLALDDVAYTLQLGREALPCRLTMQAASVAQLLAQLQMFIQSPKAAHDGIVTGVAARGKMEEWGLAQCQASDLAAQAAAWVQGAVLPWQQLHAGQQVRRISLPGYPFERERHWAAAASVAQVTDRQQPKAVLQRDTIRAFHLSGTEFFFLDHQLNGRPILPGMMYLELISRALRAAGHAVMPFQLRDLVWLQPLWSNPKGMDVQVSLYDGADGRQFVEISSGDPGGDIVLHCKGEVGASILTSQRLDIAAVQQQAARELSGADCYRQLAAMGLEYGVGHQCIERLWTGASGVLAKLCGPSATQPPKEDFLVHPGIFDSALQAALGLNLTYSGDRVAVVPFSLAHFELQREPTEPLWAWLRHQSLAHSGAPLQLIDIDLFDADGAPVAALHGLASRLLGSKDAPQPVVAIPLVQAAFARSAGEVPVSDLRQAALEYFRQHFTRTLRLTDKDIEEHVQLEQYGIDSIIIIRLTDELEKTFGRLSKTLFFEYQTLGEITDYFIEQHAAVLQRLLEPDVETQASSPMTVTLQSPADASETSLSIRSDTDDDEIAIIGLAGRYPGARNMDEFWRSLASGQDMIREIPAERWDHRRFYDPAKNTIGKTYCKHGGFIDDVDKFDPLFFGISPREAIGMEPQERLFLECAYETLQDAGYTRSSLPAVPGGGKGRHVGVFVGVMYQEYQLFGAESTARGYPFAVPGHPASIANRVSYVFNLQGPSIALDTMCSSSITTIHLACRSIRDGECEMALAGGVNVSIHPNKYLMLGQGGFASAKGRCESFGEGGEGYVPGEGIGAVLLKRKRQAIADGDQIYGIVKSSVLNHGGKTNGYTVPNPIAQAELIATALEQAKVSPRSVSYIEAHGTGTPLGDPIEIAGLKRAFARHTQDTQFCAIGSVKSNIGHCESAAGIAGISKILLQMKYRQLAPSLHSATLNPNIDFAGSPFYVQRSLTPWQRPTLSENSVDRVYPRLAGISSFGAGGANAHMLIEEYESPAVTAAGDRQPVAILLSAKTPAALRLSVQRLLLALQDTSLLDMDLSCIAYTLQIGREAMSERLALCVSSLSELHIRLGAYLDDNHVAAEVLSGSVRAAGTTPSTAAPLIAPQVDLQTAIRAWVTGEDIDWRARYSQPYPHKISLPTYPFARERYWVEDEVAVIVAANAASPSPLASGLHPLVQRNTSYIGLQRFSSRFDGSEFFLAEHRINGEKLLPAAASIEMFTAAVGMSRKQGSVLPAVRLSNLAWLQPVRHGDIELALDIEVQGDPATDSWQLRCVDGDDPGKVYCQAVATSCEMRMLQHDLAQLIAGCSGQLAGADLYARYRLAGYEYGMSFQTIESLWSNEKYAIAKLHVPSTRTEHLLGSFSISPSLLDGALQASAALMQQSSDADLQVTLPFAIGSLEIYGRCDSTMWALVRRHAGQNAAVVQFDIDLCDGNGKVCVAIQGFSSLKFKPSGVTAQVSHMTAKTSQQLTMNTDAAPALEQKVYFLPQWSLAQSAQTPLQYDWRQLLVVGSEQAEIDRVVGDRPDVAQLLVAPGSSIAELLAELKRQAFQHVLWIAPSHRPSSFDHAAVLQVQQGGVMLLFNLLKALQDTSAAKGVLELTVVQYETIGFAGDSYNFAHSGIHGLVGTIAKELPRWRVRSVDIECDSDGALADILQQPCDELGLQRMRRNGHWYTRQWLPTTFQQPADGNYLRRDGVYVVIGGAGGLGAAWTEYAIRHCNAQVIWLGRRAINTDIQEQIDNCARWGCPPVYYQADACDLDALQDCLRQVRQRFGDIHGVIHSALLLDDSTLANMDEQMFRRVYFAKLESSLNLGIALRATPPDFLLFFSSTVVFTPPPGQANYSAGCLFQNALAEQLALELTSRVKVINWGYWGSAGVVASPKYREIMARNGIASIEPEDGMEALAQLFGNDVNQLALLKVTDKVNHPAALIPLYEQLTVLAADPDGAAHEAGNADDAEDASDLADSVLQCLRQAVRQQGPAASILDIGGRGALASGLLEQLQRAPQLYRQYACSHAGGDLGSAVGTELGQLFSGVSPLAFDQQRGCVEQGLECGVYDIVIDLQDAAEHSPTTLRNIKALLKRQGVLFIASHGQDDVLRQELRREGFSVERVLQDAAVGGVLVAHSDGVVRQPRSLAMPSTPQRSVQQADSSPASPVRAAESDGNARLVDAGLIYFKRLIAEELRIPMERLDVDEPLDSYGIDSIYSVRLVTTLNQSFHDVSNTLFFEVQNIRALVAYFIGAHRAELETLLGVRPQAVIAADAPCPSADKDAQPSDAQTADPAVAVFRPAAEGACDIAVVGLSGRYAQADNLDEFWQNLSQGRNCISEIPAKRWDWRQHFDVERGKWGKHYSKWGGFVRDIDAFDPLFFQISPTEAERMDPQARLFLEEAYASIEDAGYTPATLSPGNRVGVFVGVMNADYVNGASYWSIANRVSYLFDLKGPSLAVDTACSSSLSAIHLAIDSLLAGSCDCAIAGGVNLIMNPTHYMGLSLMGMLAEGDQCRSFGADADGFVDGEGVGALVLKPLSAAVAAGDHIYGVIKGSAMNAGGRTSGFTVPNPAAQAAVVGEALRRSCIPARQISYVEAHGTGTPLGDPIEIKGLSDAFAQGSEDRQYCALGSVKSNIGHCESAAGIAGVTKVLLQMKHATLLPSLHAERSNPRIDFGRTPFKLQQSVQDWRRPSLEIDGQSRTVARSAGISSFGAGGANAHMIIQEYEDRSAAVDDVDQGIALILLSARSEEQLRQRAERLLAHLERNGVGVNLRDLAYTLQVGREAMECRLAFGAQTIAAVRDTLSAYLDGGYAGLSEFYRGTVQDNRDALSLLHGDDDLRQTIGRWFEKGKFDKLLALWTKGLQVDWQHFYGDRPARRVSLPTYPFAKEFFWLNLGGEAARLLSPFGLHGAAPAVIHPLLQENHSDLSAVRYVSHFSGMESLFADHRVAQRRLLPAAAQVEMIRCAAAAALGRAVDAATPMCLRDLAWVAPVSGEQPVSLRLQLSRNDDGGLQFILDQRTDDQVGTIHCQGAVDFPEVRQRSVIDLDVLRIQYRKIPMTGDEFYRHLAEHGLEYGVSLRTLSWLGQATDSVLVGLDSDPTAYADRRYVIDPGVLDGVLQAMALFDAPVNDRLPSAAALPFAVESITLFAPCRGKLWAELRRQPALGALGTKTDIDLYDREGGLCLSMRGLVTRGIAAAQVSEEDALLILSPQWKLANI